jgi:inorganic pyrophosphatase
MKLLKFNFCYQVRKIGDGFGFRVHLYKNMKSVSFWHDIPYKTSPTSYNMVIEIPQGTLKKLEISKTETHNPILQDTKKNKLINQEYLRYYKLVPTFNYGFIPQTWENNTKKILADYFGDNDPLDIIELYNKRYTIGDIVDVYIVGGFCLIDEGEVDWKILAIDKSSISEDDAKDWVKKNTSRIKEIQNWFKVYKTFDGKGENIIYDNDQVYSQAEMYEVIEENHKEYISLINNKI